MQMFAIAIPFVRCQTTNQATKETAKQSQNTKTRGNMTLQQAGRAMWQSPFAPFQAPMTPLRHWILQHIRKTLAREVCIHPPSSNRSERESVIAEKKRGSKSRHQLYYPDPRSQKRVCSENNANIHVSSTVYDHVLCARRSSCSPATRSPMVSFQFSCAHGYSVRRGWYVPYSEGHLGLSQWTDSRARHSVLPQQQ
jgi:hypothetical protein